MFLPTEIITVLAHFQPAFTQPSYQKVVVLLVGTLLARGRRRVGLQQHKQWARRVLPGRRWGRTGFDLRGQWRHSDCPVAAGCPFVWATPAGEGQAGGASGCGRSAAAEFRASGPSSQPGASLTGMTADTRSWTGRPEPPCGTPLALHPSPSVGCWPVTWRESYRPELTSRLTWSSPPDHYRRYGQTLGD
jgi:hypothetical protein